MLQFLTHSGVAGSRSIEADNIKVFSGDGYPFELQARVVAWEKIAHGDEQLMHIVPDDGSVTTAESMRSISRSLRISQAGPSERRRSIDYLGRELTGMR